MKNLSLPVLLGLCLGCSTAQRPGGVDPAESLPSLDQARSLLRQQKYDEALALTDRLLRTDPQNRAARLVAAEGNLALFHSGRTGSQYFLMDAASNLEKALALDSKDPESWLRLSYCQLKNSEFHAGRDSARKAVDQLVAAEAPREKIGSALLAVADNEMQIFVQRRAAERNRDEEPSEDTIELATAVLTTLNRAKSAGAGGSAALQAARVHQWLGKDNQAVTILEEGIRAEPTHNGLHEAFQNLYFGLDQRRECVAAYKRLLDENKGSTAIQWFLGRAQVALGDDYRGKTQWAEAANAYDGARRTYEEYRSKKPGDTAATDHWLAICHLSLGRMLFEQGERDRALSHYYAAYDATPLVAEYGDDGLPRVYDSFGGNYLGGLSAIGQAISEQGGADALHRSLEYFEAVIERHPGKFGTAYNNAALSARDLGVQIAGPQGTGAKPSEAAAGDADRSERMRQAMALWEKSYDYYEKAVELEPDDPRIVNDCGLMLIYHLHRDHDRARELFERAIELGEAQLAELPDDAPEEQRNFLEEATGDAYQNIGVMLAQRNAPAEEIRPFLEKAVRFYPYQRRQAALMLRRMERGGDDTGAARTRQQDPRRARFESAIEPVKQHIDAADYDAALLALDEIAGETRGYAPYHYLVGLCSIEYAKQAAERGASVALVDGLYNDAVRQLQRAVELDPQPVEPRLLLARAWLAIGDGPKAAREASGLLSDLRARGGAAAEAVVGQIHLIRAEAATRAYVASKQEGGDGNDAMLRDARVSFRELERTEALEAGLRRQWTSLEQWAGAAPAAVDVVVRAWRRDPSLIEELVDIGAATGQHQAVVDALRDSASAESRFYLGRAHYNLAQAQWAGGEHDAAIGSLDASRAAFEASMAANEAYRDSCQQWIAFCLGTRGIVQISKDDCEAAQASLIAAIETRPEVLTNDLGGGTSIKRGVLIVGDKYYQADDLAKVEALYRAAGAAAPGDVDFANNHGLFARDHGVQLERDGETARAKAMYEASYAAYTRASSLDPHNIRLRNDRALLLIYHLERDYPMAIELLQEAIADGEKRLEQAPPTDAAELRDLQESVGDAYGNLGYYYLRRANDAAQARPLIVKSLEFYPFEQRAGTQMLREIDGTGQDGDRDGGGK